MSATATSLDAFTLAYIEAMLWSTNDESTPDGGVPMDANYGVQDIAPQSLEKIAAECEAFQREHAPLWADGWSDDQAGHDFWLTRVGHGTGFWDRYWKQEDAELETAGEQLAEHARLAGERWPYVGDDGQIHYT